MSGISGYRTVSSGCFHFGNNHIFLKLAGCKDVFEESDILRVENYSFPYTKVIISTFLSNLYQKNIGKL